MQERSFLYELRAYLIYVKVGERSFLFELRAYDVYVKVVEISAFNFGCGRKLNMSLTNGLVKLMMSLVGLFYGLLIG